MLMTPRQMVALGELYLNRGRVGDRQIVPALVGGCLVHAARTLTVQSGSDVRVRVVDARLRRAARLLRVGLRRPVHHRLSRSRPGRRHDVVHSRQRRPSRLIGGRSSRSSSACSPPPRPRRYNSSHEHALRSPADDRARGRGSIVRRAAGRIETGAASRAVHDQPHHPGDDRQTGGREHDSGDVRDRSEAGPRTESRRLLHQAGARTCVRRDDLSPRHPAGDHPGRRSALEGSREGDAVRHGRARRAESGAQSRTGDARRRRRGAPPQSSRQRGRAVLRVRHGPAGARRQVHGLRARVRRHGRRPEDLRGAVR